MATQPFTFKHPGTLMSPDMTRKVANIQAPALDNMKYFKPLAAKTWVSIVDHGAMMSDGEHVYVATIAFLKTKKEAYAQNAIDIMKAWIANNKGYDAGKNAWHLANGPLEYGWMMASFARAAEILKFTYKKWSIQDFEKPFNQWVDKVAFPILKENAIKAGNWCSTIFEARMQLSIFRNDVQEFNSMVKAIKERIHQDIGDHGIYMETFRDLWHAQAGIAGLVQCAETAWHQGVDLFSTNQNSLMKCVELHAEILVKTPQNPKIIQHYIDESKKEPHLSQEAYKTKWPYPYTNWPRAILNRYYWPAGYEVAMCHFVGRKKLQMPYTKLLTQQHRPEAYSFHHGFGTYTHYLTTLK